MHLWIYGSIHPSSQLYIRRFIHAYILGQCVQLLSRQYEHDSNRSSGQSENSGYTPVIQHGTPCKAIFGKSSPTKDRQSGVPYASVLKSGAVNLDESSASSASGGNCSPQHSTIFSRPVERRSSDVHGISTLSK